MRAVDFNHKYLNRFFNLQKLQWETYAEEADHDLTAVDAEIYQLLREEVSLAGFSSREQAIYEAIASRGLVDKHPEVAQLRNQLDDWDHYLTGLEQVADRQERRVQMSAKMRPDVLRLMQLREELARDAGFPAYVDLVLASEDLDREAVLHQVRSYLIEHLPRAKELAARHGLKWSTWFSDLSAIAPPADFPSPWELAQQLLTNLGLPEAMDQLTLVCKEQRIGGYAGVIKPGRDVRVLLGKPGSIEGVRTLCHELGHALAHLHNEAHGLLQTWTASYDEAMAVLVEQIGIRQLLSGAQLETALDISLLENVRCSISFLFELDLWENSSRAEELYLQYYGQLGIPMPNPVAWASDSFRSIDPVYIHSYVLGAVVAEKVLPSLPKSAVEVGPWLVENFYKDGRQRTLYQKLAEIISQR